MRQLVLLILASIFGGCIALSGYQLINSTNDESSFNKQANYSVLANVSKKNNTVNTNAPDNFTKAAEKGMHCTKNGQRKGTARSSHEGTGTERNYDGS